MFEIGHDIFKHSASDIQVSRGGSLRMSLVLGLFLLAFAFFIGKTLYLGITGSEVSRTRVLGDWNVSRADIVDRNGSDILAKKREKKVLQN